jgi:hypothetical protein
MRIAANITDTGHKRRLKRIVVTRPTFGARETTRNSLYQNGIIDREFNDGVERQAMMRQHIIQRIRLRFGAWKPIEDKTLPTIWLLDPIS